MRWWKTVRWLVATLLLLAALTLTEGSGPVVVGEVSPDLELRLAPIGSQQPGGDPDDNDCDDDGDGDDDERCLFAPASGAHEPTCDDDGDDKDGDDAEVDCDDD